MKKILVILLLTVVSGCKQDPLDAIKEAKLSNSKLSLGNATEKFSYCKKGTEKWQILEERKDGTKVSFTCLLNDKSIEVIKDKNVQSAQYTLELWHWTDAKRKQTQGEFDGKEVVYLVFNDGKKDKGLNPYQYDYIMENKNPIELWLSNQYNKRWE